MATQNKGKPSFFVSKVTPTMSPKHDHLNDAPAHVIPAPNDHCKSETCPRDAGQSQGQSTHVESMGACNVHITVTNGHPPSNTNHSPPVPLSSSSSRVSGVRSPVIEYDSSSSISTSSQEQAYASRDGLSDVIDPRYASREALIEQLQASLSDPSSQKQSEQKEKEVITQLLEHIVCLKMDIVTLQDENSKLQCLRAAMDEELHTLTEKLFEQAYEMVDEAKGGKVTAEKRLADATGRIDAMETEMSALKNLLHVPGLEDSDNCRQTLTPSPDHKPSRHPSVKKALKKIKRYSSTKVAKSKSQTSISESQSTPLLLFEHKTSIKGESLVAGEISPHDFQSFKVWLDELSTPEEHPYLTAIVEVDVRPCLKFHTQQISDKVLSAVRENNLLMEILPNSETGHCALSGNDDVLCTHRLRLGDSEEWYHISHWCRDRIAAACDFFMYIGHIQKGFVKLDATQLFWQVCRLRAMMSLTRLSLKLPE